MKLILENWDNFLMLEAALSPKDLPDGIFVKVSKETISSGDMIQVEFVDEDGRSFDEASPELGVEGAEIYGYVSAVKPKKAIHGPCLDVYIIGRTAARKGWGPMLYDIAMEVAGEDGLSADRESLSDEAYNVWNYYLKRRPDVTAKQLDDLDNTLTPGESEDNCNPSSAEDHSKLLKYAPVKSLRKKGLKDSPVMKAYVKNNRDTIETLQKMGKLKK